MTCRGMMQASASLTLLLAATACTNVPMADPQADAEGKRFDNPAAGGGALYIYRSELMGFARPIDINIAGGSSAELGSRTYVRFEGPPGPVDIACRIGDHRGQLEVMIEPGRTRFVEASTKVGLTLPDCQLNEVSPDQGRASVVAAKRVNPQGR